MTSSGHEESRGPFGSSPIAGWVTGNRRRLISPVSHAVTARTGRGRGTMPRGRPCIDAALAGRECAVGFFRRGQKPQAVTDTGSFTPDPAVLAALAHPDYIPREPVDYGAHRDEVEAFVASLGLMNRSE